MLGIVCYFLDKPLNPNLIRSRILMLVRTQLHKFRGVAITHTATARTLKLTRACFPKNLGLYTRIEGESVDEAILCTIEKSEKILLFVDNELALGDLEGFVEYAKELGKELIIYRVAETGKIYKLQ